MTVFKPVPASSFSGQIALTKWLCITGSRFYKPDSALIDDVVLAYVENGRIVDFDGNKEDVTRVRRHYDHVADRYGIDRDAIHSWHAGIHPCNGYNGLAIDNLTRWSGTAFGNPRYLHFHSCGDYPPGEISISVFDPTVSVDGKDFWQQGKFVFADRPEVQSLMNRYPGLRELFLNPLHDFGLPEN